MNTYALLAWVVDFIHLLLIIYFVAGFFISINRHRTFRLIHSISISALLPIQLLFDFNCPLLVLDGRLRELAYPGITGEWYYKSFFVQLVVSFRHQYAGNHRNRCHHTRFYHSNYYARVYSTFQQRLGSPGNIKKPPTGGEGGWTGALEVRPCTLDTHAPVGDT